MVFCWYFAHCVPTTQACSLQAPSCPPTARWLPLSSLDLLGLTGQPWYIAKQAVPQPSAPLFCGRVTIQPLFPNIGTSNRLSSLPDGPVSSSLAVLAVTAAGSIGSPNSSLVGLPFLGLLPPPAPGQSQAAAAATRIVEAQAGPGDGSGTVTVGANTAVGVTLPSAAGGTASNTTSVALVAGPDAQVMEPALLLAHLQTFGHPPSAVNSSLLNLMSPSLLM
jgi:hypothetical protein